MKVATARAIASALNTAADRAEKNGDADISALIELRALADEARAELDAAIKAAEGQAAAGQ